ncbi:MAG: rRNA maturation RNase YbeY [Chitinophagales bacterium]|jgi:rRNA maturation RNase YbeY|nr:rRNA maturation RNase YbeY [Chitinophagales bacterium]
MDLYQIEFHNKTKTIYLDIRFDLISDLYQNILKKYKVPRGTIKVFFIGKKKIKDINKNYLNHNYTTDNITFNLSSEKESQGVFFICIQMVKDNANFYNVSFQEELLRNLAHSLFHFLGYLDHQEEEIKIMRKLEDNFIKQYMFHVEQNKNKSYV